jgi:ABC-type protease/lipase transport system fused ATPase/permease subunit
MLELVDRIIVLADGRIAIDGPKEDVLNQLKTGQRA